MSSPGTLLVPAIGPHIIAEMSRDLTFGRAKRLRRQRDFQRVFRGRWSAADRHVTVYVAPNGLGHVRLGIPVSRKFGNAVRRNRVKRLIREAVRLEQMSIEPGFDLVCIPRPGQDAELAQYRRSIRQLAGAAVKRWRGSDQAVQASADPNAGDGV